MMKKFVISVLGSFVGAWFAMALFSIASVVMSFAVIAAMAKSGDAKKVVDENTVLVVDLDMIVTDKAEGMADPVKIIMNQTLETVSLNNVINAIEKAADDENITGMVIKAGGINAGFSSMKDIRDALLKFKKSDKFIYAYGYQSIGQADYYLASTADSIFINPIAMVDIHGLSAQNMFYKKLLDKLGVEMQVIRVGTFKSAVEPYMLTEISDANRMQQEHYMGSIWGTVTNEIAESRGFEVKRLNEMADSMLMTKPAEYLLANKIIDGTCYQQEFTNKLMAKLDVEDEDDLNCVDLKDYISTLQDKQKGKYEVAVLYAEGEIDGSDDTEGINSDDLVGDIKELSKNDDVKALVLRVNSPGGSAFGSEQIWKALEDFKKTGKKFVVSMGDVAASGGYYISCGADRIFAQDVTITGSIGIFGVIPCAETLVTEKIGVTQSVVKTNANGEFGSLINKMTPFQRESMQQYVNRGYELFTSRCAAGRKMSVDSIKMIAEGRVWDGKSANEIGLVDEIGSLASAVKYAASQAKLGEEYKVNYYPSSKSKFEKLMSKYVGEMKQSYLRSELGELYEFHVAAKRLLNRDQILCIMEPVTIR